MAIKFVDKGSGDPKPSKPVPEPQPDLPGGMPPGQLPFAKTEPKPKGRKKPLK